MSAPNVSFGRDESDGPVVRINLQAKLRDGREVPVTIVLPPQRARALGLAIVNAGIKADGEAR